MVRSMGARAILTGSPTRRTGQRMCTSTTLIPGTAVTAPHGRRDIGRRLKVPKRWQQQGKWRKTGTIPGGILTVGPNHFGSRCGPGALYKQPGSREEAAGLPCRAVATAPGSADIHTDLAVIFVNLGQRQEALAWLENAVETHSVARARMAGDRLLNDSLEAQARKMLVHCGLGCGDPRPAFDRTKRTVRTASAIAGLRPIDRHGAGRCHATEPEPQLEAPEVAVANAGAPSVPMASDHV